ncbi:MULTISPECIES: hypothetical protein [unclassified Streptomyces]|uniref:hypothetical protein n=1 Tax=unclassified Streptomyces TaxID=2593676 RepID=UPI0003A7E82B|nr:MULTISPECIES: hypothetical protein [unclassified Streptomyces]MYT32741.1 hypothetical protein [Streptomyces sp. SID8354]
MPKSPSPVPALWPAPPQPQAGCARCADLDERRTKARRQYDRSAESDGNVMLRRHLREAHS